MSQTFYSDSYDGSNDVQSDLGHMETNFAALKSFFSGSSAPSSPTPVPFQMWGDTTQLVLKYRDPGDLTWWGLFHGDTNQKVYIWRNAAMDGWAVDSGVTDRVLAIKGGATYTTGAATAGAWSSPSGLDHFHQWYDSNQPGIADEVWDDDGDQVDVDYGATAAGGDWMWASNTAGEYDRSLADAYTDEATLSAMTDFRPAAYVGSLQYLDL